MKDFIIPCVILALWAIGITIDQYLLRRAALRAMSDDDLLMQMNFEGRFDNKFRREYQRRHPHGAMQPL